VIVTVASRRRTRRPGTVAIKVVLCLTVFVGVLALNLDGGRMTDERRRAQAAADAAALAAGKALYEDWWSNRGRDPAGTAAAAATRVALANGYAAGDVTVTIPPATGAYAGREGHAEVRIATTIDASFGRLFTGGGYAVAGRSVARGEPLAIGIHALRRSGADAFLNTSAAFVILNKPIVVNSSDPSAMRVTGLASVIAGRVDVTGGILNTSLVLMPGRTRTGVRPTLDPLAFLPVPDAAAMPVRSTAPLTIQSVLPTVLQPGVYRGGIRVTGASVVVMTPGTYVTEGGGFRVDSLATVTGLGVTVYNTTSASYPPGPIAVAGAGKVVLTAPLTGPYQGINFFQHRDLATPVSVTGIGLTTITGVVYAAAAPATVNGSAAVGLDILGGAYVVDSLTVGGAGAVTVNLGLNPPRVPDVRVVE
jgi:hypothetical protein